MKKGNQAEIIRLKKQIARFSQNESKVNEDADEMSDEELLAWYKEEVAKDENIKLIRALRFKLEARGLRVNDEPVQGDYFPESKVNEDDMMNGGATTANDSSSVIANTNPPTPRTDTSDDATRMDKEEERKSTRDKISDDSEKEEKEESKEGEKEYLGNNGSDQYFYLYKKPAEDVDEAISEKTDTPHDPSFGSKVRAKGLADRTPAGIPDKETHREKFMDEIEGLEKSWKMDNSGVPNESKVNKSHRRQSRRRNKSSLLQKISY